MALLMQGYGVQPSGWHVHEASAAGYARAYYITGGIVTYHGPAGAQKLTPGQLYVFPAYAPFEIVHDPDDPLCCLWFHFDLFPAIHSELLSFPREGALAPLLDALLTGMQAGQAAANYYRALVQALESYILEYGRFSAPERDFADILRRIRAAYAHPDFSIERLSADCGYSPAHFIRLFRKNMRLTPYQYITGLRMAEAVRLLREGEPVAVVARAVGYSESKVFAHAFKKKYGVAPTQYAAVYQPMA